jgi:hypothetical protein
MFGSDNRPELIAQRHADVGELRLLVGNGDRRDEGTASVRRQRLVTETPIFCHLCSF